MDKKLLSIRDVCEATGLGEWSVKQLLRSGRLLSVKVGDRRLIPANALADFVEQLTREAAADRQARVVA